MFDFSPNTRSKLQTHQVSGKRPFVGGLDQAVSFLCGLLKLSRTWDRREKLVFSPLKPLGRMATQE